MSKRLVKSRKLVGSGTKRRQMPIKNEQLSFSERMYRKGLQSMVAGTLKEQLRLPAGTADHGIHGFVDGHLKPKQYKSLRRGVKIRMTAAGLDSSTLTDKELKSMLKELKIDVAHNKPKPSLATLNNSLKSHEGWKVSDTWDTEVHWDETAPWSVRTMQEMRIENETGASASILFREEKNFIEMYSIDVRPKGTGFGSQIVRQVQKYADANNKGVIATKVQNERFAESGGYTRRDPIVDGRPLSEITGYAEYVYGDVPSDAIDYSWVTMEE